MSVLEQLVQVATLASGVVSTGIVAGFAIDFVTRGWVRVQAQRWLGIRELRSDHHETQTFLADLGSAHNELAETVCHQHDIPEDDRPGSVDTGYYERRLNGTDATQRGDFRRGGDD